MANFLQIVLGVVMVAVGIITVNPAAILGGIANIAAGLLYQEPPSPTKPLSQRERWGVSGRINSADRPIAICYGETLIEDAIMIAGPEIRDTANVDNAQGVVEPLGALVFEVIYGLCLGPIQAIIDVFDEDGFKLSDMTRKYSFKTRLGYSNQEQFGNNVDAAFVPTNFNLEKYDPSARAELNESDYALEFTTTRKINNFGLVFTCPQGLYFKRTGGEKKGQPEPKQIIMKVKYRRHGDTTWILANHTDGVADYVITENKVNNQDSPKVTTKQTDNQFKWFFDGKAIVAIRREFTAGTVTKTITKIIKRQNGKDTVLNTISNNEGTPLNLPLDYYDIRIENITTTVQSPHSKVRQETLGTGNGVKTTFQFAHSPIARARTQIFIDTVYQNSGTYSFDDDNESVIFKVAPENGRVITSTYEWVSDNNADPDVDSLVLTGVEEYVYGDKFSYPNLAMMRLSSKATENLQQRMTNLHVVVQGTLVKSVRDFYYQGDEKLKYSANAADIVADILTNPLWGIGASFGEIDQSTFVSFYNRCNEILEVGEYQRDVITATGAQTSEYILKDFSPNSEITEVNVIGTYFRRVDSAYYNKTLNGIKFTAPAVDENCFSGHFPCGARLNPTWGMLSGVPKFYPADKVEVKYRNIVRRGQISVTFDTGISHIQAINAILEPLGAFLYKSEGKYKIACDQDLTQGTSIDPQPVLSINMQTSLIQVFDSHGSEITDKMKIKCTISFNPRNVKPSIVRVKYREPKNRWKIDEVIIQDDNATQVYTKDGVIQSTANIQVKTVEAKTIASRRQAEEYGKYLLRQLRIDDCSVEIEGTWAMAQLEPMDVIWITDSTRNWRNRAFLVQDVKLGSRESHFITTVILIPYNDEKYTFNFLPSTKTTVGTMSAFYKKTGVPPSDLGITYS